MLKKRIKTSLIASCVASAFALSPLAQAVSDTSVENRVNFSTDVIYQVFTDRLKDGDLSNNPTGDLFSSDCSKLKKYCGGDWQGIIDLIDNGYFAGMGISALWISQPIEAIFATLNDADGSTSYHGYWGRDFKKTNPFFGNFDKFDELITKAHDANIKIVIDFAPNHTSPANEDDPSYADNGRLYNNGELLGGYTNDVADLFHHNGGTDFSTIEDGIYRNLFDLADFNHQNPVLDKYMADAIKLWLNKGIDGIRVDAVKHMPFGWQKRWVDEIYDHEPVFIFGEWFLGVGEVDQNNHDFANESGMSLLDFRFGQTTREVFKFDDKTMVDLNDMIVDTNNAYHEVIDQVTFIDNHDMDRFHDDGADPRRLELALAFTLTSRGVPGIYYGTEQYLKGNGDPANRRFMPSFNTETTAYKLIGALAPLRKTNPALAYGDTQERWLNDSVYVYERQFGDSVVLVAMNKSRTETTNIVGLVSDIPAGNYSDVLNGLMGGNSIEVSASGAVTPFELSPGEVGVWEFSTTESSPIIGHVGPMQGKNGSKITIDGRGFGNSPDAVQIGSVNATIESWEDTQIVVSLPSNSSLPAGKYDINVVRGSVTSNAYDNFEVLTSAADSTQRVGSSVRFIVNNAETNLGENVYLVGNVAELGGWDPEKAIGPIYNGVITQYPTWYMDVYVPSCTEVRYKFIRQDGGLTMPVWENGSDHVYNTPCDDNVGTAISDWQN